MNDLKTLESNLKNLMKVNHYNRDRQYYSVRRSILKKLSELYSEINKIKLPVKNDDFKKRTFDWDYLGYNLEIANMKFSLREISKQSGASHTAIFRAMKGKKIDIQNVIYLTDWLGIDIKEFII